MEPEQEPPLVKLDDYRARAQALLAPAIFDYIDSGAGDERTVQANRRDFDDLELVPRCLRDVSAPLLGLTTLGQAFGLPIGISPMAFHRLVHGGGEVATARAAHTLGLPLVVSAMASVTLEQIATESHHPQLWLQTYVFKDRGLTRELVRRAERVGYKAIVLTLGCPVPGLRDRNLRNRFSLPEDVTAANFGRSERVDFNNPIHSVAAELDPALTWRDVAWLREQTALPIVAKGVLSALDVGPALERGVAAIVVSNHGGRQLDTTVSTIAALPAVLRAVAGRVPVYADGGFRRGTDVLKALALGAECVFVGRPILWALAHAGEAGVVAALRLLAEELRVAMQLAGCASLAELRRDAPDLLLRRR